jgi:glucokinase
VADIGGTHARLARWSAASGLSAPLRVHNDEYAGPIGLLQDWFARIDVPCRRVVLALAMPVGGDIARLTNRAWSFEPQAMLEALRLDALVIINDFAAAAAGLDTLSMADIQLLNPGVAKAVRSSRLVLGPGTGLGTAAILDDEPPRIIASEAGHMTFGSVDPFAARLTADGCRRWGRVSWERVLCGEGLAWIDALVRGAMTPDTPAGVARRAHEGNADAGTAVRLFSRLLGEFAGDACLAFQATGGVYLCGGVLHGLRTAFDPQCFLAAFAGKGRFSAQLARVSCFLAAGHELGLQGAARYLAGECRMPAVEWMT